MGYSHTARFKKQFNLEKVWIMNVDDIVEITKLDKTELLGIYEPVLAETQSRTKAINEVCAFAMKRLFPKQKPDEKVNVAT
jgi:hypothetical protein